MTTATLRQSEALDDPAELPMRLDAARARYEGREVGRPACWGGFRLAPVSIELLEFNENRLHLRTRHVREDAAWSVAHLQP